MAHLSYRERRPGPLLLPHVECVWEVWDPRAAKRRAPDRVVPDGCPELILHLEDPFARRVGRRWRRQPRAFLAGTLTRPWLLRAGRRVLTLGVRFRPGAVPALFELDMAGATDREVPLAELVGARSAGALLRDLGAARGADARAAAAEAWLGAQLRARPPRRDGARPAVEAIRNSRGQAAIRDIAGALGFTPRRLERAFRRDLGIRPKLFARIVRLNAVLASLDEKERSRAVDLALEAGYFDQPHLLRDFRLLAGRKPLAGRADDGQMAQHFTAPERLRALLGE